MLAILLILPLTACGSLMDAIDDPEIREMSESMLDAVITDDRDTARSLFPDILSEEDFLSGYEQLRDALYGVSSYELTATYRNHTTNSTQTATEVTYYMTTDNGNFVVVTTVVSDYDGVYNFRITPEEYTTLVSTGTIGNMKGANTFQWIMLALALIETIFVILVLVDCCRRKIKMKPLWIILILVGICLTVSLSASNMRFNFNIGSIANYSALIIYGDESFVLRFLIPVGAILYLILRRKITKEPKVIEAEAVTIEDVEPTEE